MKKLICLFLYLQTILSTNAQSTFGKIVVEDPSFTALIDINAKLEIISEGFEWSEGPVWNKQDSSLLFSDVPKNTIYRWKNGTTKPFLNPSGFTGLSPYSNEPGSNGLAIDANGYLYSCEHGDRRISKMPLYSKGGKTTVTDNFQGKRFNSPNDLVLAKNGTIYFTDPPYGLPQYEKDPSRETPLFGVYRVGPMGITELVVSNLKRPNGIALSPDEKTLYVSQSDKEAYIMAYDVTNGYKQKNETVFFDASYLNAQGLRGAPDGLRVDKAGNIFTSGPGGILVIDSKGKLLGRIETGQATSNVAWGEDGSTLFITADMYIMKIKTRTQGYNF
ncbi:MAG: SMP-30/gluconolactonase/LRE family protein [Leadbetterella sp.]